MVRVSLLSGRIMNGQVEAIREIDEALIHAWQSIQSTELNTAQRDIIETFINNLLDRRLESM
jgi:hypothetical protein